MPLEANTFVGLPSALRFMLKALGVTTCIGIGVAKIVDFCSTITAVYVIALSNVSFFHRCYQLLLLLLFITFHQSYPKVP